MELQFNKTALPCLRQLVREVQDQEVTQEVKLADSMPDIGKVLSCWGQILIRSKQWRAGAMEMTGGVHMFTLYLPEDGSDTRCVVSWLPFQMKWDLPDTACDGTIQLLGTLRSADARSVSARKLMLRANVSLCATALEKAEVEVFTCTDAPEDVQLLQNKYPMKLPKEAGEKAFTLEETLHFPTAAGNVDKILRYEVSPQIIDQKVMAEKVVFRGVALLHTLCRTAEGELKNWDFEIPFSQYTDLEQEYDRDAEAQVYMAVTNLELEPVEDNAFGVRIGLLGQYTVYDCPVITLVEDAYSTARQVQLQKQELIMPTVLDMRTETVHIQLPMQADRCADIVDVAYCLAHPRVMNNGQMCDIELQGSLQLLYKNADGQLCSVSQRWEDGCKLSAHPDSHMQANAFLSGKPLATVQGEDAAMQADVCVQVNAVGGCAMQMVTGLQIGEKQPPDPERPSLILRRAEEESLWDMAKRCGATVDAIRKANHLTAEPEKGQFLLIPLP